jgi:hypothetical protein
MGGCHPNRETLSAIERSGYRIGSHRDLTFPSDARISPVSPRVLGSARR